MNASQRRKYGRKVERINRKLEDVWFNRIRRTIQLKANAVIYRLRSGGTSGAMSYLSNDLSNPSLGVQVKKLYEQVGLVHARRVNDELKKVQEKRIGFNSTWIKFVNDYLEKFLFEKITFDVNSTTRDALMRAVQRGIEQGLGVDDIIRILENWPYARFQAARIVRTEINRAANVGAMAGSSTFKFEQQKEWIAAMDNRTRGTDPKDHANHRELDGNIVNENAVFTDVRNGDELQFPGDPNASAASTVNCRCSVALTAKRDENGRLIPKRSGISVILPSQNINTRRIVTIGKELKPDYSEILLSTANVGKEIKSHLKQLARTDEIIENVNQVKENISDVVYGVDNKVRGELNEAKRYLALLIAKMGLQEEKNINDLISLINSKEYNPEINLKTDSVEVIQSVNEVREDLNKNVSEVREDVNNTGNKLALLINKNSLKDEKSINDLIRLINSKEYSPEIKVKTDSPEVIESVNDMRAELIKLLQALRNELIKKNKWLHTIHRDDKELIKTITSQEI